MQGIFISYRRLDSQSAAGRLADSLKEQLPEAHIFRDVETIEPGMDFVDAINAALESCGVLLAVIGPHWSSIQDDTGKRRLDDPADYTRLELATALARTDVRVIPVLVDGAAMPAPDALPADLQSLARRNALELTDKRWDYDVSQLVATLRHTLGLAPKTSAPRNWHVPSAAALAVLLAAAGGYLVWHESKPKVPPATLTTAAPTTVAQGNEGSANPNAVVPATPKVQPQMQAQAATADTQAEPCPIRLSINRDLPTPFTCTCSTEAIQQGAVWGTDTYTDDSGLCRAAVHAGAIPSTGGRLTVLRVAGRPLYIGSRRNGIQSSDYGASSDSIRFPGVAQPAAGPEPCPIRLSINRELPTPFTCTCNAEGIQQGAVWGTDTYTDDSGVCRAAVHAGAIPFAGGTVTVTRVAGRQIYPGTTRNGIQSSDYGAYSDSIRFQAK
jgi:LCCL domain/TIR domain